MGQSAVDATCTPNVAVERFLYGTGVGLLLGQDSGFRTDGSSVPVRFALEGFLLAGALCFLLGWMLGNGNGPLARWFSHETEEAWRVEFALT